jgi:hypothetical protein
MFLLDSQSGAKLLMFVLPVAKQEDFAFLGRVDFNINRKLSCFPLLQSAEFGFQNIKF